MPPGQNPDRSPPEPPPPTSGDAGSRMGQNGVVGEPGAATDWWQTGVVYQIYPRSFADASGDGLGDLGGIIEHLDHLAGNADSLGVDAIWLSPIYPSPDLDFGYDVADYVAVDPRYGSLADFDRLVEAAHRRGIKVILDLVLNHSSDRHAWFQSSRGDRDGPHGDWYIWRDSPGRSLLGGRRRPNNWRSFFGGSAWAWDERRGQFYLHTFLPEQPDLNWRNPAVREALLGVVRTWLDRGVDGFRLDVFNVFFKDAALRSNPWRLGGRGIWSWQRHQYDRNQPELAGLLDDLRAIVDERPGRMTVGELFDGTTADAAAYTAPRHLIFDFTLLRLPWSATAFRAAIRDREKAFGDGRWPTAVLSNHDQPRHAGRFAPPDDADARVRDARAKVAATLLLTLRGTPFLYYGEEIALGNLEIPNARAFDPPARRASWLFPWWNRDQARGPMPWRPGPGGGFSSGDPWLPLPPDAETRNVATQAADRHSVLATYRRLLELRRAEPALHGSGLRLLEGGDSDVLAYVRVADGRDALVAINFGATAAALEVPAPPVDRTWVPAFSTDPSRGGDAISGALALGPLEALVAIAR